MFGIDRSLPGIPGRTISRSVTHVAFREKSIRVETSESKKGRRRYQEHTVQFLIIDGYFNDDRSYHYDMLLDREFRSEEQTSELQSLMRAPYAVFCLTKNKAKEPQSSLQTHMRTALADL